MQLVPAGQPTCAYNTSAVDRRDCARINHALIQWQSPDEAEQRAALVLAAATVDPLLDGDEALLRRALAPPDPPLARLALHRVVRGLEAEDRLHSARERLSALR